MIMLIQWVVSEIISNQTCQEPFLGFLQFVMKIPQIIKEIREKLVFFLFSSPFFSKNLKILHKIWNVFTKIQMFSKPGRTDVRWHVSMSSHVWAPWFCKTVNRALYNFTEQAKCLSRIGSKVFSEFDYSLSVLPASKLISCSDVKWWLIILQYAESFPINRPADFALDLIL